MIPLEPYLFTIRDRTGFYKALRLTSCHPLGEGSAEGLLIERRDEGTLHEYAHAVTLGMCCVPGLRRSALSREIEETVAGLPTVERYANEVRTVAAELFVLYALDAVEDEYAWLETIAELQSFSRLPFCVDHILSRASGCRGVARDAKRVVRRIRYHARLIEQTYQRLFQQEKELRDATISSSGQLP